MPHYATSKEQRLTPTVKRYCVLYEDGADLNDNRTFGVSARSMAEATALTIEYIDRRNLHTHDSVYFLTPVRVIKLKEKEPTYKIN